MKCDATYYTLVCTLLAHTIIADMPYGSFLGRLVVGHQENGIL